MPDGVPMPLKKDPAYKDWSWFPHGEGKSFTFTRCLEPLESLRDDLTVLGGLSHPAARSIHGHSNCDQFLTGAPPEQQANTKANLARSTVRFAG